MMEKKSMKDFVLSEVFESIIKGIYQPGEIIREKALAEKYGVSKSPIRDALMELCNENVLRCLPRYGYEVVRLTQTDVDNIISFRIILESSCAEKSFDLISETQIAELEEINRSCYEESHNVDVWKHWENNQAFHLKLISYYQNEYIYLELKKALNAMTRAFAQFYWDKWNKLEFNFGIEGHMAIVDALKARDKQAFIQELVKDIGTF